MVVYSLFTVSGGGHLATARYRRKLAAILSADARDYCRLMGEDEAGTIHAIRTHFQAISEEIAGHRGRLVDTSGDNLLADFASVVDAVQCAVAIQEKIRLGNAELPEARRIVFRIGINLGDVIEEEGRIYGDGVNIAARIESLAEPGAVYISGTAYDQVKNKITVGYEYQGEQQVKNIQDPVRVYKVLPDAEAPGIRQASLLWAGRWKTALLAGAAGLFVAAVAVSIWYEYLRPALPRGGTAHLQRQALLLPDKPSIAVLPFENMTGDPKQEYFTDGFTEQIITSLSKIPALFVISRNSTFTYRGKSVKVQQVGEELGVRYVLEGSVQKSSSRIRINVQLIDATTGHHVWAESYDRNLKDIFSLQDDVILKILTALQVNLTSGEQVRVWAEGTKSLEAYMKLMQCREYLYRGNRESILLARRMAEEAIVLDPKYANAYVWLGATHMNEVFIGASRPKESIAKAIELTQKALAMNGSLGEAHSRLGVLYSWSGRYDEGIVAAERGVELNPNSGQANFFLGLVLRYAGKSKEAIPVLQKALRLEPLAPDIYFQNLALVYFQTGDCKEAIAACEKGLKRELNNLNSRVIMAAVYGSCGREKEARNAASEVLRIKPDFTVESYTRILPYKNPSDRDRSAQGLRKAGLP